MEKIEKFLSDLIINIVVVAGLIGLSAGALWFMLWSMKGLFGIIASILAR
jgi:hypothetical protein